MEDELDMANGQKKSKSMELKRKAELNTKPAKRKKLDNLENWGAEGVVDTGIRKWLIGDDDREEEETGIMMNLSMPTTSKTIRMKQLEVNFSGILVNREHDDNILEGWKGAVPDAQNRKIETKVCSYLHSTTFNLFV